MSQQIVKDAPWAIIAVMGVTGAGKSTFIQSASGDDSVIIGHSLKSCKFADSSAKISNNRQNQVHRSLRATASISVATTSISSTLQASTIPSAANPRC